MSYYGFVVTDLGRELIAKLVAGNGTLKITKVLVGSGAVPDGTKPAALTDLVAPVAAATSTTPTYDGSKVEFVVEYRSDLNGGLDYGFWLSEFGIYADDPDNGETLIYYGTLGEHPQYVSAKSDTGVDVRRFPVAIIIGEGVDVIVTYKCEAWMTADDISNYCTVTILPQFVDKAQELIDAHNESADAHGYIRNNMKEFDSRLKLLEQMFTTNVTGNPFSVSFQTLDGVDAEGVWNAAEARIEF